MVELVVPRHVPVVLMDLGRLLVQPDASIKRVDPAGLANRLAVVDEQVMHIVEAIFGLLAGQVKVAMGFAQ